MSVLYCCGCDTGTEARLTNGAEIYPHRPDLHELPFWKCDKCGNFVGCHHKTKDRTRPMKIEIEISEEAVNAALKEQIDAAIRISTGAYQLADRVRRAVSEAIQDRLDDLIRAQIADTPAIEEAVRKQIEKSLKSRLNKLLFEGEK